MLHPERGRLGGIRWETIEKNYTQSCSCDRNYSTTFIIIAINLIIKMKNQNLKPALIIALLFFGYIGNAQNSSPKDEIVRDMEVAAADWNKGDLDGYVALYDSTATMMTQDGRVGLDVIKQVFVKYYFDGKMPKQQLAYDHYELTKLGENYVLLTGRFILKANLNLPERIGIFSVILVHRADGWKLIHDHSG